MNKNDNYDKLYMKVDDNMDKHKLYAMIMSSVGLMLLTVGITYSFFNYTRTGEENSLRTGRIYFNTTEGVAINMTNVFPLTSEEAEEATLDSITVGIVGDTNYTDGEEFEVSIVDVNNTINGKAIPINFIATYTAAQGGTIGSSSDTYMTSRLAKDATIYSLTASGEIEENKRVLVGYIDNGATGISGTLTVKAYVDADRIAITDTYNGPSSTPSDQNGTLSTWVDGRVVFTTTEWNSLSSNPISFKIKTESNEGIWVDVNNVSPSPSANPSPSPSTTPVQTISCDGCMYTYVEDVEMYTTSYAYGSATVLTSGLYSDYNQLVSATGKNYFIGVKRNGNNEVTEAYACGVRNNQLVCLKGTSDGSAYASNKATLQASCGSSATIEDMTSSERTTCPVSNSDPIMYANSEGNATSGSDFYIGCHVTSPGAFICISSL